MIKRRVTGKRKPADTAPGPQGSAAAVKYRCASRRGGGAAADGDDFGPVDLRPGGERERGEGASTSARETLRSGVRHGVRIVSDSDHLRECDGLQQIGEERDLRDTAAHGEMNTLKSTSIVRESLRVGLIATTAGRFATGQDAGAGTLRKNGEVCIDMGGGDVRSVDGCGTPLDIAMDGEMNTEKCTSSSSTGGKTDGASAEGASNAAADGLASGDAS